MRATVFAYPATLTRGSDGRLLVCFRDFPEALTDGETEEDALYEASDALSEALMSRIADGEDVPDPSPVGLNEYQIAPDATVALKVALQSALKEKRATTADLSRLLHVDHKEARRLLDPHEASKVPRLVEALRALGYSVTTAIYDAGKRERILSQPGAPRRTAVKSRKGIKAGLVGAAGPRGAMGRR
ncbi:MAG: type II toxin-antitoxin system HicB family antitoxin [Stellaceae bacterium]